MRRLKWSCIIGLLSIALMAVTSHVMLTRMAMVTESDGKLINIAGRQRMLSQKIAKDVAELDLVKGNPERMARVTRELKEAHQLWRDSHVYLQQGGGPDNLPALQNDKIKAAFAELQPEFERIDVAVRVLNAGTSSRASIEAVLNDEAEFLRIQNDIVQMFEDANREKTQSLRRVMAGLMIAMLLTLFAEGIWVFAPAVRAMRRHVVELEDAAGIMSHQARHDALTGLSNRGCLSDHLHRVVTRRRDTSHHFVLMVLDFDRFKVINDTLGHEAGDQVLIEIARRMRSLEDVTCGCDLTCFRLGGDEFVMLLEGPNAEVILPKFAELGLELFAEPHMLQGQAYVSTASIGAVPSSRGHVDAVSILRDADLAMYHAKEAGKGRMVVFDESMYEVAQRRRHIERNLKQAVAHREIEVWYQPVRDSGSTHIEAVEAQMVWDHAELGRVTHREIIEVAEQTEIIHDLTDMVLETVAGDLADPSRQQWDAQLRVHISVGRKEFLHPGFRAKVETQLARFDVLRDRICLELADLANGRSQESVRPMMLALQRQGVTFAIDQREGGPIAFQQLAELPVEVVKLVMPSFVTSADQDLAVNISLLEAVQSLARGRGVIVTGTCVRSPDQMAAAAALGIDLLQGPLIGEPAPLSDASGSAAEVHAETRVAA